MAVTKNRIQSNLDAIRDRIAGACAAKRREPESVRIVAVTKSVDFETIRNALDAGLTELGENRHPQITQRAEQMAAYLQRRRNALPAPVRWHMVGHLQRNKVRVVLPAVDCIHSVDSLRLAEEINARAEKLDRVADVLLQINCSEEPQKFGCAVGAAGHLATLMGTLQNLRLIGLMTMAPLSSDAEAARATFVRLRELFEDMRREGAGGEDFRELSMGMSQDYAVAVEEGATILRIGSALFA